MDNFELNLSSYLIRNQFVDGIETMEDFVHKLSIWEVLGPVSSR